MQALSQMFCFCSAQENRWTVQQENGKSYVEAPGGFKFYVEEDSSERKDPVKQVSSLKD